MEQPHQTPPTDPLDRLIALLEALVYQRSGSHVSIAQDLQSIYAAYRERHRVTPDAPRAGQERA